MELLLPKRHAEKDLFMCDFGDVIPKSDIASMEHPFFTLSTKPDIIARRYEHNGNIIKITPSVLGMPRIHDKDILIFCISQLMAGINQNTNISRKVKFRARDLLITTNRGTGGREYGLLKKAFERLSGTRIETNIKTNSEEVIQGFGVIDSYKIISSENSTRMAEVEVTLSEWLYNSVIGAEVLSIDRDYFRLRKPIERRLYEIAEKHCGKQPAWRIGVENLHKKVGSAGTLKKFKESLKHVINNDHLPSYHIEIEAGTTNIIFRPKILTSQSDSPGSVMV